MHKSIPINLAILALFMLILCSACISQPTLNQTSGQNSGLTQITASSESTRISFDTAQQKLKEYRTVSFNQSSIVSEKLTYILAKDVDDQGKATSWIFGMSNETGSRLLIHDRTGWTVFSLGNSTLPSEEIIGDRIVSPGTILSENKAAIMGSSPPPIIRELELKGGIYTLTVTSDSSVRVIKFNATTGVLIV